MAILALFFFVPRQPQICCDYPFLSSTKYRYLCRVTNTMKTWLNVHVLDQAPCAFNPLRKSWTSIAKTSRYLSPKLTSSCLSGFGLFSKVILILVFQTLQVQRQYSLKRGKLRQKVWELIGILPGTSWVILFLIIYEDSNLPLRTL